MTNQELAQLQAKYPEGIPQWMVKLTYDEADAMMKLRREAFPKTAK